jgi:hypothetical protein
VDGLKTAQSKKVNNVSMSNNTMPPAANWEEFRGQVFELIENRHAIAATFKYGDIYFFVTRCRHAFISPDSDKGQEALDLIIQNGSFRLVADTWGDFLAMFPPAQPPADEAGQLKNSRQADDQTTVQPEVYKEGDNKSRSGRGARDEYGGSRRGDPPSKPMPAQRAAEQGETRAPSARPGSGRPF